MSARCILVAEDDAAIRCALVDALRAKDYLVIESADGQAALEQLLIKEIDLAILDVNMPYRTGFELVRIMQRECPGIPSILLTAQGEEEARVKGLTLGADDYVAKPFSMMELLARIAAVLRRYPARQNSASLHSFGGQLQSEGRLLIMNDGRRIALSEKEYQLLHYFFLHPKRIIPQEELLLRIWNSGINSAQTRTVAVTLNRLKEKLGSELAAHFENVRGQGYRFNLPS